MIHRSSNENTQRFLTKLTNLLFVLVLIYPFLEGLSSLLLRDEQTIIGNVVVGEFLRTFLPYLLGVWLYFYSTQRNLSKTSQLLLPEDGQRGELIRQWLREAGLGNITVYVSKQKEIAAQAFGTQRHGYISVTQNALDSLKDDELRALITHEAAHHYFGDFWKLTLVRGLTIAILISRLAQSMAGFPSTMHIKESGISTILYFLPVILGYFAYALMSTGILAISRLRELVADNFALSILGDASIYMRLMARISYSSSSPSSKSSKLQLPKAFEFHPDGLKRLRSLSNPNQMLDDVYFALAFLGLLLGALIGIHGVSSISILLALPCVVMLGSPALYFVVDRLDQYGRKISMAFTFAGSASLTVMLLTLAWSIVRISNPLAVSQLDPNSLTEEYYFAPLGILTSDFHLLFDNYLVTFIVGGLLLVIFLFLVEVIKKMTGRFFIGRIRIKSVLILLVWIILAFGVGLLWLNAFGPHPFITYLYH
jgi:Zn-dependent protease with chaperone function